MCCVFAASLTTTACAARYCLPDCVNSPEHTVACQVLLSLGCVPTFTIACCRVTVQQAASEDELRYSLGLSNYTTGKGKVDVKETNIRPIEVFMCSVVSAHCLILGVFIGSLLL